MVYIISHSSPFCIRNSKAALVMMFGNVPVCDSQASSYAYNMWVRSKDLIRSLKKVCAIHQFPIKYYVLLRRVLKYVRTKRIRLILPDLTAIGLVLSHASHCSNTRRTAQ